MTEPVIVTITALDRRAYRYRVETPQGVGDKDVILDPEEDLPLPRDVGNRAPRPTTLGAALTQLTAADGGEPRLDPIALGGLSELLGRTIWGDAKRGAFSELRINTDDPFIASLPWAMARSPIGPSLAVQGLPASVQIGPIVQEAGLGPTPRILVCAPDPGGDTHADAHVAELRAALPRCILTDVPKTARQLGAELKKHKPDILYYYGHGILVSEDKFNLVLQKNDGPGSDSDYLPIDRFVDLLTPQVRESLALVYLNCCFGGTASPGGAPIHVGKLVPALISNRTSALIAAARFQAVAILKRIVEDSEAPHLAVASAAMGARSIAELAGADFASREEQWWLTPVAYVRYRDWKEPMRPGPGRLRLNERHTLKLGRDGHVRVLKGHLERSPPAVSLLLWHAAPEDGLEPLAERLRIELGMPPKLLTNTVTWPDEGKAESEGEDRKLRQLLSRQIEAQMRKAAGVGDEDASGLARILEGKLRLRRGIALIRFAPIPVEITYDRAVLWIGAAADALGNAVARPIEQVFNSNEARIVAFLPVAARGLIERVPESFTRAVTSTKLMGQRWLPPLNAVREDELDAFLSLFKDQSEAFDRDFYDIVSDIYESCPERRYEKIRAALHEYNFP